MYLDDVNRLHKHWKTHPPLRALVAAVAASLGVKFPDPDDTSSKPMTAEEAMRLYQATGGRIPGMGG